MGREEGVLLGGFVWERTSSISWFFVFFSRGSGVTIVS